MSKPLPKQAPKAANKVDVSAQELEIIRAAEPELKERFGIVHDGAGRADCPICGAPKGLYIVGGSSPVYFVCANCGEDGNSRDGWQDAPGIEKGYFTFDDMAGEIQDLYIRGLSRGLPTGWSTMQEFYTVREGEWALVTGIPGHGKSEWLDALMVNMAVEHKWKWAIFSPEHQPVRLHASRLIEKIVGKQFHDRTSGEERMTHHEMKQAAAWCQRHFYFLWPKLPTIEALLDQAYRLKVKHGIRGVVIDPWNEIEHQRPPDKNETEYVSDVLSKIRRFCRRSNMNVWLVAHPTKMRRDPGAKLAPVPTPYDVSGSAHFYNKADVCISVWRDAGSDDPAVRNTVEVHFQKVKFKATGKVGLVRLWYLYHNGIFCESDTHYFVPPLSRILEGGQDG